MTTLEYALFKNDKLSALKFLSVVWNRKSKDFPFDKTIFTIKKKIFLKTNYKQTQVS